MPSDRCPASKHQHLWCRPRKYRKPWGSTCVICVIYHGLKLLFPISCMICMWFSGNIGKRKFPTAFAHDFYQYIVSSNMFSIHGLKIPIISKRSRLSQHFLPITHNYPQLPTITHYIHLKLPCGCGQYSNQVFHPDTPALSGPIPSTSRGIPWGLSICCKAKSSLHPMGQEHCASG